MRAVLDVADSAMTYRSRYLNLFDIPPFVDLLLLDDSNPRSLAFQLEAIERNLNQLPRITRVQRHESANAIAAALRLAVGGIHSPVLAEADETGKRAALVDFSTKVKPRWRSSRTRSPRPISSTRSIGAPALRRGARPCDGIRGPPSHDLSLSAERVLFLPPRPSDAARDADAARRVQRLEGLAARRRGAMR